MDREYRTYTIERAMRSKGDDNSPGNFTGIASTFNSRTEIGNPKSWGFYEEVSSGAFDRALREGQDVVLVVDHNPSMLLGRTASGTLTLSKEKAGLRADASLPDTSLGRDTAVLLDRGDLSSMSFAFEVTSDTWTTQEDGTELRIINDVNLYDVSIVASPAYKDTSASLRSVCDRARGSDNYRVQRAQERQARFDAIQSI